MDIDFGQWDVPRKPFTSKGSWELTILELRLMLFYEFRADYRTGWGYHERDDLAESLLRALGEQTGLPYNPR